MMDSCAYFFSHFIFQRMRLCVLYRIWVYILIQISVLKDAKPRSIYLCMHIPEQRYGSYYSTVLDLENTCTTRDITVVAIACIYMITVFEYIMMCGQ